MSNLQEYPSFSYKKEISTGDRLSLMDIYLNKIDDHISEVTKFKLFSHSRIDSFDEDSLETIAVKLTSRLSVGLASNYFKELYEFSLSAYSLITKEFMESNSYPIGSYTTLGKIIDALFQYLPESHETIQDFTEYSEVYSLLAAKEKNNETSSKAESLSALRPRELFSENGNLTMNTNYLTQFIYDLMSLNDILQESVRQFYEDK